MTDMGGPAISERLKHFRRAMEVRRFDACLIPMSDPYLSEYIAAHDRIIAYLSGFSGSAGYLVITAETARLFVDSRYTLQARNEVDSQLFSFDDLKGELPLLYALNHAPENGQVGYNPALLSVKTFKQTKQFFAHLNIRLSTFDNTFFDEIWPERPAKPENPLFDHPVRYAGESREKKLKRLRRTLADHNIDVLVLNKLESMAWLLNLRGADLPHSPLFQATALVDKTTVRLFVDSHRLDTRLCQTLERCVTITPPTTWKSALRESAKSGQQHLIDPASVNAAIYQTLDNAGAIIKQLDDPIALMQAIKNDTECDGMQKAHIRDGQAICRFIHWLAVTRSDHLPTEGEAADYLDKLRAETALFVSPSFPTISAFGPSAALPHYRHGDDGGRQLTPDNLYLFDSGGQYYDGTTDITRTLTLGPPTPSQKRHYTLVLKGLIALTEARFPEGITGAQLDSLARQFLWQEGLDFGHGTGHGVGAFLNVHEGPNAISPRSINSIIKPGMIQSNEPGFYHEGNYGIRLENLILARQINAARAFCSEMDSPNVRKERQNKELEPFERFKLNTKGSRPNGEDKALPIGFDSLTLAPFDRALVDVNIMDAAQIAWLNNYHKHVYNRLHTGLESSVASWLHHATRPL